MPWLRDTTPRPPHWGHGVRFVPGLAPLPLQVRQVTTRGTSTVTSVPRAASRKSKRQIVPEIIARLGPGSTTAAEAAAEAEDVSEDVAEGAENVGEIRKPGKPGGRKALMPVSVIEAPLFRVMEDLVSLGGLFKLLFGGFIPGIAVRMIFEGYLAVFLLDLIHTRVPGDSQDLVIILFLVCHILLCKSHLYRFYFVA